MNNANKDTTETKNTENTSQDNPLKGSMDTDENIKSSLKDQNKNSKSQDDGSFWAGLGLILLINFLALCSGAVLMFLAYIAYVVKYDYVGGFFGFFGYLFALMIGIGQLLYVIPWLIKLKKSGESARAKGIIIGALITAFLNGGCYFTRL